MKDEIYRVGPKELKALNFKYVSELKVIHPINQKSDMIFNQLKLGQAVQMIAKKADMDYSLPLNGQPSVSLSVKKRSYFNILMTIAEVNNWSLDFIASDEEDSKSSEKDPFGLTKRPKALAFSEAMESPENLTINVMDTAETYMARDLLNLTLEGNDKKIETPMDALEYWVRAAAQRIKKDRFTIIMKPINDDDIGDDFAEDDDEDDLEDKIKF